MNPLVLVQTLQQMNQTLSGLTAMLTQIGSSNKSNFTKTGGGKTRTPKSIVSKSGDQLTGVLMRVFGPLIAFGTMLSAATSGFQLFTGAIRIAATAAGSILLPIFVVFAAGLLTFVDMLTDESMLGAMKSYFDLVISAAVSMSDSIKLTASLIREFGVGLKTILDTLKGGDPQGFTEAEQKEKENERARIRRQILDEWDKFKGENPDLANGFRKKNDGTIEVRGQDGSYKEANEDQKQRIEKYNKRKQELDSDFDSVDARWGEKINNRRQGKNDDGTPKGGMPAADNGGNVGAAGNANGANKPAPKEKDFGTGFREMLKLVGQELQISTAPKAQQFSLAAVSRQAQLAALNQSPFESKMLELTQNTVNQLVQVVNKIDKIKPVPVVGQ